MESKYFSQEDVDMIIESYVPHDELILTKYFKDSNIANFLILKVEHILKRDISKLNNIEQFIQAILYYSYNDYENENELKTNYKEFKKTGNTEFITKSFRDIIDNSRLYDDMEENLINLDRGLDDTTIFTTKQKLYIKRQLDRQELQEMKNRQIVNNILKDYPQFRYYVYENIDYSPFEFKASIKKLLSKMKFYDLPLSTSIKKMMTLLDAKSLSNVFKEYKVNNLKDLIQIPKSTWIEIGKNPMFEDDFGGGFKEFLEIVAENLYPRHKLDIPVNRSLAKTIFMINCFRSTNDNLDECEYNWEKTIENTTKNERLQIYRDMYYGLEVPEAPPAPRII